MHINICLLVSLKDIFNMPVYVKMTGEMINGNRSVNCIGSELSFNYCQVRRVSGILIAFITKQFNLYIFFSFEAASLPIATYFLLFFAYVFSK